MIQVLAGENPVIDGFWQRLDPRIKLISIFSLVLSVVATPIHHYQKFFIYGMIVLFLGVISRVRLKHFFLRFVFLVPLLVFFAVSLLLFSQEQWQEKELIFLNLFVKTFLTFCSFGILIATVSFPHIIKSMELMRFPTIFTSVLGFAHRYVLLFQQEARRMARARKSRNFGRKKTWRDRKAVFFVIPYFLFRVLERSQRIYIAMLSRGYRDVLPVVTSHRLTFTGTDYLFGIIFHLLLGFILVLPLI